MSAQSPELQARIAEWRIRAREGRMTIEEYREVLVFLRAGRAAAPAVSAGTRARAAKPQLDPQALLEGLGKL